MEQILVIQTAFIGDAILATALLEQLHQQFPDSKIDFLVRKGHQGLVEDHPFLRETFVLDKSQKYKNAWTCLKKIRSVQYDLVLNLQRFALTGGLTVFSKAKETRGFDKNPLSFWFSKRVPHPISFEGEGLHEIERNFGLIQDLLDSNAVMLKPKLYPRPVDYDKVRQAEPYVCVAPSSVWFTKQWPADRWIGLLDALDTSHTVFLLGGKGDYDACAAIKEKTIHPKVQNWAGKLHFLESAALMQDAAMNYVNDSAPLHIATAMNAPVTAVFCSTVPAFGFTPLSDNSRVVETRHKLDCRPCGLHGKKTCPKGHFKCGDVLVEDVL